MKKLYYLLFTIPLGALAVQPGGTDCGLTFCNPLGETNTILLLLEKILSALVLIGIPVLVIFIVYAGFLFISAQGDPEKINKARSTLFWAVIGGAVLIGARVIATIVDKTVTGL